MPFVKGQSGNPGGRRRSENYVDRARFLLGKLTVQEIIDIVNDKKRASKLKAIDFLIYMRIAEGFKAGGAKSIEVLLDRVLGKPTEQINVQQTVNGTMHATVEHFSVSEIEQWVSDITTGETQEGAGPSGPH